MTSAASRPSVPDTTPDGTTTSYCQGYFEACTRSAPAARISERRSVAGDFVVFKIAAAASEADFVISGSFPAPGR